MPAKDHAQNPGTSTAARPHPGRIIFAVLLLALLLFGTLEILYRAYWAHKCVSAAADGKSGYISLYVVGESIAAGEPYDPGITPCGLVTSMLGGRVGGLPVKEFSLGKRGDTIYPQFVVLEHALRCRGNDGPGAVLIYSANNDAANGHGMPAREWVKENILSRSMLLSDVAYYTERRFPSLRIRTLDTYEHYLRQIVDISLRSGLTPILTTVPSNIADMDPGLFSGTGAGRGDAAAVLSGGLALETKKQPWQAIRYYSDQTRAHPEMRAYLAYRTGKCYQALGLYKAAGDRYREAAELPFPDNFNRAKAVQNEMIRGLAKSRSVPLVDALEIFEHNSPHGLVGSGLFADGHHPNMKGYLLLTSAWAEKTGEVFHEPVRRRFPDPQAAFKFFSYGKEQQSAALLTTGRWFFNVAARHLWPSERLKTARSCFQSAVKLDPDNFSAWLALGLTEAAMRGDLLSEEKKINWLAGEGLGFYHKSDYALESGQLGRILEKLASYGVPAALLKTIAQKAASAETRKRLKNTAGPGIFPQASEQAARESPKTLWERCRRLADKNKNEEALPAKARSYWPARQKAGGRLT